MGAKQGKYEEAELAETRLSQLRVHEAHMKELQEFNEIWDRKVAEFEAHAANLQSTLSSRHQQEHDAWLEKTRMEVEPRTPRWSRDLLNIRKIQETLAKQKNYA